MQDKRQKIPKELKVLQYMIPAFCFLFYMEGWVYHLETHK